MDVHTRKLLYQEMLDQLLINADYLCTIYRRVKENDERFKYIRSNYTSYGGFKYLFEVKVVVSAKRRSLNKWWDHFSITKPRIRCLKRCIALCNIQIFLLKIKSWMHI